MSGVAEALLEGVEQWRVDENGEGSLLLSSKQQNRTFKCSHKERDFSWFPLLTNPLHVHLWKLATFPDCNFTWQKPSVFVELGGLVSFIRNLVGSVITDRDNQRLQPLLRLGVRWVGGNFFCIKRESSTNTHSFGDEFNVRTCQLRRPVTWNVHGTKILAFWVKANPEIPFFQHKTTVVSGTGSYREQLFVYTYRWRTRQLRNVRSHRTTQLISIIAAVLWFPSIETKIGKLAFGTTSLSSFARVKHFPSNDQFDLPFYVGSNLHALFFALYYSVLILCVFPSQI